MFEDVKIIELEIHSYCNRRCPFCANSYIDRHSGKIKMPERIFKKIIDELAELKYNGVISFSRYNEPFADRELLKRRIRYIRKKLPNVIIVSNTNGDFDTKGIDIDQITEMDYDGNKKHYISKDGKYRITGLMAINNRGGAVKVQQIERKEPCYEPKYFVGIDYTGDVTPCCNIRHDVLIHKPFILGNLKNKSLKKIFESKKANKFREDVANMKFPDICRHRNKIPGRYTGQKGNIEGIV
jgi:radical SAM protein with 4Fe4S-binding SPASM domain